MTGFFFSHISLFCGRFTFLFFVFLGRLRVLFIFHSIYASLYTYKEQLIFYWLFSFISAIKLFL